MFDSLLGRKFTVRCKQAIKCIGERLMVIRKRKQAMLNFLRQDIADLLRDGHDSNALNRMDALIVEINHLACYDMIGKFCESILRQISLLQKQRECPAEHKEAVSTLIFAAARFSDLPELCDLRHTFMSRYGSAMETSVSLEFIEKLASRTFTTATKIQLMQKIAQELSVEWVPETLGYVDSDYVASQCANREQGDRNDGICQAPINTAKDELENVNPYPPATSNIPLCVHPKRNKDDRCVPPRAREVLDQIDQEGGKVLDGSTTVPRRCEGEADVLGAQSWRGDHIVHNRSSEAQGKLEDGDHGNGYVFYKNDTHSKRSPKDRMHHNTKMRNAVGQYQIKNDGTKSVKAHAIRSRSINDAVDSDDNRKQSAGEAGLEDAVNPAKIPPKHRSKSPTDDWDKDEVPKKSLERAGTDADIASAQGRQMDGPCHEPYHDRPMHMIPPPPYIKRKVSASVDHSDPCSPPTGGGFDTRNKASNVGNGDHPHGDELVVERERSKPRSVRRSKKPPFVQKESDDAAAVSDDEPMHRIQRGQRHHRHVIAAKKSTPPPRQEEEYGSEEEEDVDRLLIHYSTKRTPRQSSRKHGEKADARVADHARDGCGGVDQPESPRTRLVERVAGGDSRRRHDGRAAPFPARVASMPPDGRSPSGGRAQRPSLPDYEEFAARFAALRRVMDDDIYHVNT